MKHNQMKIVLMAIVLLLSLSGCGNNNYKPVPINEQTDKCPICNMQVKNNQFSTEIILENGRPIEFDDIGHMFEWMKENKDQKIANSYVRDYYTKSWIDLKKATYVYNIKVRTPMAYNVISFTKYNDAKKFVAQNGGKLLTYADLTRHSWIQNKEMQKEMKGNMKMNNGMKNMDMDMNTNNNQ